MDQSTGEIVYSEVLAFIDRQPDERRQFIRLSTKSGRVLTLTPQHLVPIEGKSAIFAARVQPGDRLIVRHITSSSLELESNDNDILENNVESLSYDEVLEVKLVLEEGVYAPLTAQGTLLVNDVVASCYALVDSQWIAHMSFLPYRLFRSIESSLGRFAETLRSLGSSSSRTTTTTTTSISSETSEGVMMYASFLYSLSDYVLPKSMIYD